MTRQENILTLTEHLEHWKRLLSEKICDQSEGEKTIDALHNAIKALEQETCEDTGEISDGYHTFNQLYHQRAILFATIVNQNTDIAWKSYKHSDGKYCFDSNGEWFIVGVDTPDGSYTYHYSKEYWDYFKCKELDCGKEWDGHTEEDVTRLLSLKQQSCSDAVSRQAVLDLPRIKTHNVWGNVIYESVDVENVRQLPSVTPQPKFGYISIADAMTAFDDFMCNDIEPEGQEVFLELLKDMAEGSEEE